MLRRTPAPRLSPDEPGGDVLGGSLRDTAIRSGAYLVGRETLGVGIRLLGLVLVLRMIGPASFGIYAAAYAYVVFAMTLAQMGAEVFLIRQPGPLPRRRYDEVFTTLLVTTSSVVVLGEALTVVVAPWLQPHGVVFPTRVLLLSVPVNVLWAPMQACIERQFAYRRMGMLELGGDVVLYGTAVPLAFVGAGPWSMIAAYFAWQAWLLIGSMALSGLWPRLAWSSRTARELLAHGRTYALTTWVAGARSAVLTLIVGSFTGAVGVGLVNFAQRLVGTLNFTDRGVHRIGMVTISKARHNDPGRLSAALEEGTLLIMVVAALPFTVFGLAAHWVVPHVFGHDWLPALPVYVLLALWATLRVPVTVQRTLLYAYGHNLPPAITSLIELVIVSGVAAVAVPRLGIVGFGIASVVAVSSTVYTHFAANRLAAVRYRRLVPPLIALVPPVLVPLVPEPWALLLLAPPLALMAVPSARAEFRHLVSTARSTVARRRRSVETPTLRGASSAAPPGAVPRRAVLAAAQVSIRPFGTGGPDMELHGTSNGKASPAAFPPFQEWRLQVGMVVDPTNPRIADRAALDAYGVRIPPLSTLLDGDRLRSVAPPAGARGDQPDRGPGDGGGQRPAGVGSGAASPEAGGTRAPEGEDLVRALLLETDPVTGLPTAPVVLARMGRVLGAMREGGWTLAVIAVELRRADTGRRAAVPEEVLTRVAAGIRAELRFDDLLSRLGPSTFVAVVPLVGRGADGATIAPHVEGAARSALAAPELAQTSQRWSLHSSHVLVPLPCDHDADEILRRVLGALDG